MGGCSHSLSGFGGRYASSLHRPLPRSDPFPPAPYQGLPTAVKDHAAAQLIADRHDCGRMQSQQQPPAARDHTHTEHTEGSTSSGGEGSGELLPDLIVTGTSISKLEKVAGC